MWAIQQVLERVIAFLLTRVSYQQSAACTHSCIPSAAGAQLHTGSLPLVLQLEVDKLQAQLERAKSYGGKARQAKQEAREMQQELDQIRAQAKELAAAAASGEH
jgi:hypothetical protein